MTRVSNADRAKYFDQALAAYVQARGDDPENCTDEEVLTDLLCDMMHWMNTRDEEPAIFMRMRAAGYICNGGKHFMEELTGDK